MPTFTALLRRFDQKGEKTGWTYLEIPTIVSDALRPGQRTSFRVKGTLDEYAIKLVALIPMGRADADVSAGAFILPVNAEMRRGIRREAGATVRVSLEVDTDPVPISADLLACLTDDPAALTHFQTLTKGHQNYFGKWIDDAKTVETRTKRLTQAVTALAMGMGYPEMIRYFKKK